MAEEVMECLHAKDIFRVCRDVRDGYFMFTWWDKAWKKMRAARCHRHIYEQCFGQIPEGLVVMHTCDNRWCVQPCHLRVGTPKENTHDALRKGRMARGSRQGLSKLTEADIPKIRDRLKGGDTMKAVAEGFGVSLATIAQIKYGKTWRHV